MVPIMFSVNPVFAISIVLIFPPAKIIVFGGVATGNINAIEADSVTVIIKRRGFIPIAIETDAATGIIICVTAVFDVSSVRKLTAKAERITISKGETICRYLSCSPMNKESPVDVNPLASANPPPKSNIIPHGTLLKAV